MRSKVKFYLSILIPVSILVLLAVMITGVFAAVSNALSGGFDVNYSVYGDGTSDNPYKIWSVGALSGNADRGSFNYYAGNNLTSTNYFINSSTSKVWFVLAVDIELQSGESFINTNLINSYFDGDKYSITMNGRGSLFNTVSNNDSVNPTIKNLKIYNNNITIKYESNNAYYAGLASIVGNSLNNDTIIISNCNFVGNIYPYTTGHAGYYGGLVGQAYDSTNCILNNCSSNLNVYTELADSNTDEMYVGGIIGKGLNTTVNSGVTYGKINLKKYANAYVGGIAGKVALANGCANFSIINNSTSCQNNCFIGGVIGDGDANNSYNSGSISCSGLGYIGGVVGNGTAKYCYNIGEISATNSGAIAGKLISGENINNYYLSSTSSLAYSFTQISSAPSQSSIATALSYANIQSVTYWSNWSVGGASDSFFWSNNTYILKDGKEAIMSLPRLTIETNYGTAQVRYCLNGGSYLSGGNFTGGDFELSSDNKVYSSYFTYFRNTPVVLYDGNGITKTNYIFAGWAYGTVFTNSESSTLLSYNSLNVIAGGNLTMFAQWDNGGTGEEEDEYRIYSVGERVVGSTNNKKGDFYYYAGYNSSNTNYFTSSTNNFKQMNNLTFTDTSVADGYLVETFNSIYLGNEKTISATGCPAIFNSMGGEIRDLTIINNNCLVQDSVSTTTYVVAYVESGGYSYGFEYCTDEYVYGGIFCLTATNGTFTNCSSIGSISCTYGENDLFNGWYNKTGLYYNDQFEEVTSEEDGYRLLVFYHDEYAQLMYSTASAYVGGICGFGGNFYNCKNYADINAENTSDGTGDFCQLGGIVGKGDSSTIQNCINYGNFSLTGSNGDIYIGGIIGFLSSDSSLSYCGNWGSGSDMNPIIGSSSASCAYCYSTGLTKSGSTLTNANSYMYYGNNSNSIGGSSSSLTNTQMETQSTYSSSPYNWTLGTWGESLSGFVWRNDYISVGGVVGLHSVPRLWFEDIPVIAKIYFNLNGASGDAPSMKYYIKNQTIALPTASRAGYRLIGWSQDANATSGSFTYLNTSVVNSQIITLYAIWETIGEGTSDNPFQIWASGSGATFSYYNTTTYSYNSYGTALNYFQTPGLYFIQMEDNVSGASTGEFKGIYDGNNLNASISFASCSGATIKNLTLTNMVEETPTYLASYYNEDTSAWEDIEYGTNLKAYGFAGSATNSYFENININYNYTGGAYVTYGHIGGIVAYAKGSYFINCSNLGNLSYINDGAQVYGQYNYDYENIDDDENRTFIGYSQQDRLNMGGIVGYADGGCYFIDCLNSGKISTNFYANIAGIVGYSSGNSFIDSCINYGEILSTYTQYSGSNYSIQFNYFTRAGGIGAESYSTIKNCINYGKVSAVEATHFDSITCISGTKGNCYYLATNPNGVTNGNTGQFGGTLTTYSNLNSITFAYNYGLTGNGSTYSNSNFGYKYISSDNIKVDGVQYSGKPVLKLWWEKEELAEFIYNSTGSYTFTPYNRFFIKNSDSSNSDIYLNYGSGSSAYTNLTSWFDNTNYYSISNSAIKYTGDTSGNNTLYAIRSSSGENGSIDAPYTISSVSSFISYANSGYFNASNLYFLQTSDLNFTIYTTIPLVDIRANYNGNSKAITIKQSLFKNIYGSVYDLTISGTISFSANQSFGVLAGENYGNISNCVSSVNITQTGASSLSEAIYFGGIVVINYGTISNCEYTGVIDIAQTNSYSGGIAGKNLGTISNCHNGNYSAWSANNSLYTFSYSGTSDNLYSISHNSTLSNYTALRASSNIISSGNAGGIVGYNIGTYINGTYTAVITNCYNLPIIISNGYSGGIVGISKGGKVDNCYNLGDVFGGNSAGGILGYTNSISSALIASNSTYSTYQYLLINNSYNNCNRVSGGAVGGIVGFIDKEIISPTSRFIEPDNVLWQYYAVESGDEIEPSYDTYGNIILPSGTSSEGYGSESYNAITIYGCENNASIYSIVLTISNAYYAGGIVGYMTAVNVHSFEGDGVYLSLNCDYYLKVLINNCKNFSSNIGNIDGYSGGIAGYISYYTVNFIANNTAYSNPSIETGAQTSLAYSAVTTVYIYVNGKTSYGAINFSSSYLNNWLTESSSQLGSPTSYSTWYGNL